MKKIYIDMDGVLTDFNRKYMEMFGLTPSEIRASRDRKAYSAHWHKFVDSDGFVKLDWHPGGQQLVDYLAHLWNDGVQLCILSSAGGFDRHREVQEQKMEWLYDHGIGYPAVIVPGRRFKAGFADRDSFIIDDTADVVDSFIGRGGHGIIHVDVDRTIEAVEGWL